MTEVNQEKTTRREFRWKRRLLQVILMGGMFMFAISWTSKRPDNLGTVAGQLRPCPETPNCVSSTAEREEQKMPPLQFDGLPEDAMERLLSIIDEMPRSRIVNQSGNYLYVEFTSLVFRYVDDVEFLLDAENKKIDFRSASRVGYSDMGVNRNRMNTISERFNQ